MQLSDLARLGDEIAKMTPRRVIGRVIAIDGGLLRVLGLERDAALGDLLQLTRRDGSVLGGEVVRLQGDGLLMLPDSLPAGVALGDRVTLRDDGGLAPCAGWIGRIVDPYGQPLDGRPLPRGPKSVELRASPPEAASRRRLGPRLETGMAAFNTFLPIVRGQRIGLFAGSGVGKSRLLGHFARHMQSDIVVIALVGERGRELREFVETVLGPEGLARAIVIAATSDKSPLVRRRCAWAAMAVAEHFRDQGHHVLFLCDSVTRFAEAHREIATAAGEAAALRGFPPSTSHLIMSLCERAGPGAEGRGDVTAIFTVLVAGSDMEEPVADILRGVLDGHVVLDRQIAERGRFPAIDMLRSVSRSLPEAASAEENTLLTEARRLLGAYEKSEVMIRAGLYSEGSDPLLDRAVTVWDELDGFLALQEAAGSANSFARLGLILRRARQRPVRAPEPARETAPRSPTRAAPRPGNGPPLRR